MSLPTKKRATHGSSLKRIITLVPEAEVFLEKLAHRGESMAGATNSLLNMLNLYGTKLLAEAIQEVVILESPKLKSLHFSLKRLSTEEREEKNHFPINIKSEKFSKASVKHHDTGYYDKITGIKK